MYKRVGGLHKVLYEGDTLPIGYGEQLIGEIRRLVQDVGARVSLGSSADPPTIGSKAIIKQSSCEIPLAVRCGNSIDISEEQLDMEKVTMLPVVRSCASLGLPWFETKRR